jgi:hypothetical protein
MGKHKSEHCCSIAFAWCDECKSMHVAMFDADYEIVGMGDIPDLDVLITVLQEAKKNLSHGTQRLQ